MHAHTSARTKLSSSLFSPNHLLISLQVIEQFGIPHLFDLPIRPTVSLTLNLVNEKSCTFIHCYIHCLLHLFILLEVVIHLFCFFMPPFDTYFHKVITVDA